MKKASIIIAIMLLSIFAPFDFSCLDFNFAFAEEATPKNSPPVAVNDFYKTEMNTQLTVASTGVLENDSAPDGNMLLSAKLTDPANGMAVMGTDGRFVYVPNIDFKGIDSFTYTISVGNGGSVTKTVALTVNAVNDAPTSELVSATVSEDSSVVMDVLAGASDIDGDALSISEFTQAANGTITEVDGKLVYTPADRKSGVEG